jgi:ABC-type cobalamin transport system permease subunit
MSLDVGAHSTVRRRRETRPVIREELDRLLAVEERHRRLLARLVIAVGLTVAVAVVGSVLIYLFENGKKGGDVHGVGDAVFFTLVQLLTVSSSLKNPVTTAGKVVDVALEAWAIFVVTAVAGSFASFFTSGDSS